MKQRLAILGLALLSACGGSGESSGIIRGVNPWADTSSAILAAQPQFPGGLAVEVMTPAGVVFSQSFGGFTPATYTAVASASKMVSATVLLRLVEQGTLSLDTRTKDRLTDRSGLPWSGNMGEIRLRDLLSFTSGISGDVANSEDSAITLDEAVKRVYDDQKATASTPGSYFYYGSTHLRIAARMAELATGKPWRQLFDEQLRTPLGWGALSTYGGGTNPNPAGSLACTGLEYTRFVMLQLRQGLDGTTRLLAAATLQQQRQDAFGAGTIIIYSPYRAVQGKDYHYGFGNWLETAGGGAPSLTDPVIRFSSTGTFGWAPWVAADGAYGAVIMTQQAQGTTVPSENLKAQLDPLIRAVLAQNPAILRSVP